MYREVNILEYLKQLHSVEWGDLVKDTKFLRKIWQCTMDPLRLVTKRSRKQATSTLLHRFQEFLPLMHASHQVLVPISCPDSLPNCLWYGKLPNSCHVENPETVQTSGGNTGKLEHELESMVRRKSQFIVSMRQYSKFNKEEHENAEFLFRAYPELQIAYIEEEQPRKEGGSPPLFSALINSHFEFGIQTGKRRLKLGIRLLGNSWGREVGQPESCYHLLPRRIPSVDRCKQGDYLGKCLKIRNILDEFEV